MSLREKLTNFSAKVVSHARYVIFQMAEAAAQPQMLRSKKNLAKAAEARASDGHLPRLALYPTSLAG